MREIFVWFFDIGANRLDERIGTGFKVKFFFNIKPIIQFNRNKINFIYLISITNRSGKHFIYF